MRGYRYQVKVGRHAYIADLSRVPGILDTRLAVDPEAKKALTKTAQDAKHAVSVA